VVSVTVRSDRITGARAFPPACRRLPDSSFPVAHGAEKTHPAVYLRALANSTAADRGWKFFSY